MCPLLSSYVPLCALCGSPPIFLCALTGSPLLMCSHVSLCGSTPIFLCALMCLMWFNSPLPMCPYVPYVVQLFLNSQITIEYFLTFAYYCSPKFQHLKNFGPIAQLVRAPDS